MFGFCWLFGLLLAVLFCVLFGDFGLNRCVGCV